MCSAIARSLCHGNADPPAADTCARRQPSQKLSAAEQHVQHLMQQQDKRCHLNQSHTEATALHAAQTCLPEQMHSTVHLLLQAEHLEALAIAIYEDLVPGLGRQQPSMRV